VIVTVGFRVFPVVFLTVTLIGVDPPPAIGDPVTVRVSSPDAWLTAVPRRIALAHTTAISASDRLDPVLSNGAAERRKRNRPLRSGAERTG
jgi:hypothetical protein